MKFSIRSRSTNVKNRAGNVEDFRQLLSTKRVNKTIKLIISILHSHQGVLGAFDDSESSALKPGGKDGEKTLLNTYSLDT